MRLFIAIPVPDAVKEYAAGIKSRLQSAHADVKWVERENMHLTVKFLGEVEKAQLPMIKEALQNVQDCSASFNLSIHGMGFFPNRNRPRVIWLGVGGELEKASFLAERTDAYLSPLGFEEERSHRFHLTMGRIRSERGLSELLELIHKEEQDLRTLRFPVENFYLMESVLSSAGPHYKVLASYDLMA